MANRCASRHSHGPTWRLKSPGSDMLIESWSPSNEVVWIELTEIDGITISGGRLYALWKWRASQPVDPWLLPGVPSSM